MTLPATRIGDADIPHCSGMVRAEGSDDVFVNGIPWSLMTHVNTVHLFPTADVCANHAMPIATGSWMVFVNGLGAGRVTDRIIACTAVAVGSPNVNAGPPPGTNRPGDAPVGVRITTHQLEVEESEETLDVQLIQRKGAWYGGHDHPHQPHNH